MKTSGCQVRRAGAMVTCSRNDKKQGCGVGGEEEGLESEVRGQASTWRPCET